MNSAILLDRSAVCELDGHVSAAKMRFPHRNFPFTRGVEDPKRYGGPCYLRLPNRNRSTPPTAAAAPRTRDHIV
jgi:hypothetical protein